MLSKTLRSTMMGNLRNGCNFIAIVQNELPVSFAELVSASETLSGGNKTAIIASDDGDNVDGDIGDGVGESGTENHHSVHRGLRDCAKECSWRGRRDVDHQQ